MIPTSIHLWRRNCILRLLALSLASLSSLEAVSATKPVLSVDLLGKGLPADAFTRLGYSQCPYQYLTYRTVEWLDPQIMLVAFSTTPSCAKEPGILSGTLRLLTFDLNGNSLHSTDIPYDAGEGIGVRLLEHDGIWIGPDRRIILEIPGSHLKAQPNSRDKVLVLSAELQVEQEIDTDSHVTYYDGIRFGGVTDDRQSVLFWKSDEGPGHDRECFVFRGKPLQQVGTCHEEDLAALGDSALYRRSDLFPKNYYVRAFAGMSSDGRRASLFGVKEGGFLGGCDLINAFCPSTGKLLVFELATNHPLFTRTLPLDGRASLSPSGMHLAVLERNRLELFSLP